VIIDWFHLLIAVFLLWLPRQWLRFGRRVGEGHRRRSFHDTNPAKARAPGDQSVSFRAEFAKLRNYIDLLRGGLGSVMLFGTFEGIEAAWRSAPGASLETYRIILTGQLAIVLLGVLIQTFRFEHRLVLFPPIFYFMGLTIGLCGLYPAAFACLLVWTINLALPNPAGFLSVHALLALTFGLLFNGLASRLPFAAGAFLFVPVLLSLLSRRRLALFNKRTKSGAVAP
jgi:hypothetical protein